MEKKKMMMFYQPMCPFCRRAFQYIDELTQESPIFGNIEIEKIDELKEAALADTFDYYYVPTFYVNGKKVHEGGIYKEEMRALLQSVIDGTEFKLKD